MAQMDLSPVPDQRLPKALPLAQGALPAAPAMPLTGGGERGTAANNFTTSLAPGEEPQYQSWKAQFAPKDSGEDYDLPGAYKYGLTPDPQTGHWSDRFKKPNEPTFSDQSQYAQDAPEKAGSWGGPNKDQYIPPVQSLESPTLPQAAGGTPTTTPGKLNTVPLAFPQLGQQNETQNQQTLRQTQQKGSGISNIHNPILKTLATIGDVVAGTFAPRAEQLIPGTEGNYALHLARAGNAVKGEEEQQMAPVERRLKSAQATEQESLPALHESQTDVKRLTSENTAEHNRNTEALTGARNEATAQHQKDQLLATLAAKGEKLDETGQIVPQSYEELSEPLKAVHDLKSSQGELAEAAAQLKKAQAANQPALVQLAQQRVTNAQNANNVALRRLGLSEQREERMSFGTRNGEPLPGALLTDEGQPVGTGFQQNVRPTGTQRDAAGRAVTMTDLDKRIRAALANPELAKGTGPLAGRLSEIQGRYGSLPHDLSELRNDLVSYGAFQAGLHPVRGIGALQYFDKVMGGLAQDPQELLGKLDSNLGTAGSVKDVGLPKTVGSKAAKPAEAIIPYQSGGKQYNIPASQEAEFLKDHPEAKKSGR